MWRLVAIGLFATACDETHGAAKAPRGLRVPLPEGWVAASSADRLTAGPKGRAVMSLENRSVSEPSAETMAAALRAAGVAAPVETEPGFVFAKYTLDGGVFHGPAFIAVRSMGERAVWCASTGQPTEAEVVAGVDLCRKVTVEGEK